MIHGEDARLNAEYQYNYTLLAAIRRNYCDMKVLTTNAKTQLSQILHAMNIAVNSDSARR